MTGFLRALLPAFALAAAPFAQGASFQAVRIPSAAMQRDLPALVVLPDSYAGSTTRYPVVYLLHGAGGDCRGWVEATDVESLSDRYQFLIVCPQGEMSWYFDSPLEPQVRFETHVAKEVVAFVDQGFRTIPARAGRAITGLSMGGHGALFLALRHREAFGAAGSMSGGVDIRPFPTGWELNRRLGDQKAHAENWERHTVINVVDTLRPGELALIIDCGTADFFYPVNRQLHEKLLRLRIGHDYIERPGAHDWNYWKNAVLYQALFFHNFFENGRRAAP